MMATPRSGGVRDGRRGAEGGQGGTTSLRPLLQVAQVMRASGAIPGRIRGAIRGAVRAPTRRVLALAILVAVAGVAAQSATDQHYLPVEKSTCWECHSNWVPAMPGPSGAQTLATAVPPPSVELEVGKPFTYNVQIQNTWLADVTFVAPALDLRDAPSLRFAGGHPEDNNLTTVAVTPVAGNLTAFQGASTVFTVPPGATFLQFGAAPQNKDPATGPDVQLVVYPPSGQALPAVNENGPGQAEVRILEGAELLQFGSGVWRVTAQFKPLDDTASPPRPPILGRQSIDITEVAKFETAELRVLALPRTVFIGPQASLLQAWDVVASAPPAPGEKIRVYANVTGHYDHDSVVPTGDWGNFTAVAEALVIDGAAAGQPGKVLLVYESATAVRPAILNGATWSRVSEAVGYAAAFLLVSSILSGGMFGRASRRGFNHLFGSAKRRVAFHNFLSYGLTVAAIAHTVIFVGRITEDYDWTWGLMLGGLGLLAMLLLGVTGALQVPMIRKWNYGTWRWTHYGLTVAAILFTLLHMLLDGRNFGPVQDALDWKYQLFPFRPSA